MDFEEIKKTLKEVIRFGNTYAEKKFTVLFLLTLILLSAYPRINLEKTMMQQAI